MQRTPTTARTELVMPLQATANELIAVGAAITTYQRLLTRTSESTYTNWDTIKLLDSFQKRLTQLPTPQEASYGQL